MPYLPASALQGALNYGNLQLPTRGPVPIWHAGEPNAMNVQALRVAEGRPAAPGMQPMMPTLQGADPQITPLIPDLETLMQSEALQMTPGPLDPPPVAWPGDPNNPLMQNLAGLEAARARANLELTGPVTTQAPASMLMPDIAQPRPPAVAGPAATPARTAAPGGQAAATGPAGSAGMMPALGSPTMSLPGVPPPPALDPRRGTPSVTPTSSDPNDRSPENTVGQDEGLFGVSNDIWETLLEAGLRTMAAGEQGMSTLGALGTGGLEALQGLRGRRREEASDARQREIEDRQYALDKMMADLQAEEVRRPRYQMVQDASGNLIAIDTRNPAPENTIDTGIDQRVPGTGGRGAGVTFAQRLEMFQAATALMAKLAEQGIDISLDEALAQVERFMAGQSSAATGDIAQPTTQEEYDALAPGTPYVDPNTGELLVKGG